MFRKLMRISYFRFIKHYHFPMMRDHLIIGNQGMQLQDSVPLFFFLQM